MGSNYKFKLKSDKQNNTPSDLFRALIAGFNADYEMVIKIIDEATDQSLNQDRALFLIVKAMAYDKLGMDDMAMKCIDKVLEVHANNALAWNMKGDIHFRCEEYKESLEAYENAIKYSDKQELSEALLNKVDVLLWTYDYKEALEIVEKILVDDPQNLRGWNYKSELLNTLERYNESLEAVEKGLKIDGNHFGLLNSMGNVLINLERYKEALEYFTKATSQKPSDATGWYNKYRVLAILERDDEASEASSIARRLDKGESIDQINSWYDD